MYSTFYGLVPKVSKSSGTRSLFREKNKNAYDDCDL